MAVINAHVPVTGIDYVTVAASQSAQVLTPMVNGALGTAPSGAAGLAVTGLGDFLLYVTYIPGTTAAGAVSITDGSGSAITIFVGGGTTALIDLRPQTVWINAVSTSGPWKVTTGANVTAIAVGKFS